MDADYPKLAIIHLGSIFQNFFMQILKHLFKRTHIT